MSKVFKQVLSKLLTQILSKVLVLVTRLLSDYTVLVPTLHD